MACGDRYKHLMTLPSGNTADYPWGNSWLSAPTFWDYDQWKNRANEIALMASAQWKQLERVEEAKGTQEQRAQLIDRYNALVDRAIALPSTIQEMMLPDDASWAGAIDRAVSTAREGTCMLELIDDAIVASGSRPPALPGGNTPKVGPDAPGSGKLSGTLLAAMALGGVGLWLYFKKGKGSDQ